MITGCQKYGHITPVLKELQWLPVNERIQLKTLVFTYESLNGQTPAYLAELIHEKVNTTRTLYEPNTFSVAAPTLWNTLPNQTKIPKSLNVF